MREISRQNEPVDFTEWRAGSQSDINYGYGLIPSAIRQQIKDALITEQRGLCAYTGIGISAGRSHIEHLLPQVHCGRGQENVEYRNRDVAYGNMVACYPGPGSVYVPLGALFKANWPSLAELHLFVSPRSRGCEQRFTFSIRGKISAAQGDEAAAETIKHLGLDDKRLEALRNEAIEEKRNTRDPDHGQDDARLRPWEVCNTSADRQQRKRSTVAGHPTADYAELLRSWMQSREECDIDAANSVGDGDCTVRPPASAPSSLRASQSNRWRVAKTGF